MSGVDWASADLYHSQSEVTGAWKGRTDRRRLSDMARTLEMTNTTQDEKAPVESEAREHPPQIPNSLVPQPNAALAQSRSL